MSRGSCITGTHNSTSLHISNGPSFRNNECSRTSRCRCVLVYHEELADPETLDKTVDQSAPREDTVGIGLTMNKMLRQIRTPRFRPEKAYALTKATADADEPCKFQKSEARTCSPSQSQYTTAHETMRWEASVSDDMGDEKAPTSISNKSSFAETVPSCEYAASALISSR